ncbi:uncharacterized protein LOC122647814 [Telopea speciosissima]|uniref:uncharacterized protein LOC122647814 n=1 Tax=Telopea speciosissima TaxID=54955 RepID=UPI001CC6DD8D|nr:uncharacterized protein LOC122647814 [Telopea speciosissima]
MAFLLNSMNQDLANGYFLLENAAQIWMAAKETYGQIRNDAQVYELRKKIHETTQMDLSTSKYYALLRSLWQQLDHYTDYQPTNPTDIAAYRKHVDKIRVYDFLAGLNMEYDQIRVQVLSRIAFPTLEQSYALVHTEESRRTAMLHTPTSDRSALKTAATAVPTSNGLSTTSDSSKVTVKCEHCNRPYHTKAPCWKLQGKPADFEAKRAAQKSKNKANHTEVVTTTPTTDIGLSKEELQALRHMLQAFADSTTSTPASSSTNLGSNFVH